MPKTANIHDATCAQCQGKCWVPNNQSQTQSNAMKFFGYIPNNCVNDQNGRIHCPVALGNL